MTCEQLSHSPSASCLLRAPNLAPAAGPFAPSSHSTDCSSELIAGIRVTSATSSHTRAGGAPIQVRTSTVGLSA